MSNITKAKLLGILLLATILFWYETVKIAEIMPFVLGNIITFLSMAWMRFTIHVGLFLMLTLTVLSIVSIKTKKDYGYYPLGIFVCIYLLIQSTKLVN